MKHQHKQFTPALLLNLCFLSVSLCQGANEKTAGTVFTVSHPISNGFVFVEGQYVEAPYVVSRKDLAIYINDRFIANFAPLVKDVPKSEKERPVTPTDITPQSTPNDKNVGSYLFRMQNYLFARLNRNAMADEMEKVLNALPCVKKVQRSRDGTSAIVTYVNGQTDNMTLVPPTRKPVITSANAVEYVSRDCRDYVQRLEKGDVYSFSHNGSRKHTFGAGVAKEVLPGIIKVLRSSQDDVMKAKQLADMLGMPAIPKEQANAFVARLSPSKQLDERVDALIRENK